MKRTPLHHRNAVHRPQYAPLQHKYMPKVRRRIMLVTMVLRREILETIDDEQTRPEQRRSAHQPITITV